MIYRESWAAFVTRYANALLRGFAAALILRGLRNRTLFSPNWECQPHAVDHGARAEEEGPFFFCSAKQRPCQTANPRPASEHCGRQHSSDRQLMRKQCDMKKLTRHSRHSGSGYSSGLARTRRQQPPGAGSRPSCLVTHGRAHYRARDTRATRRPWFRSGQVRLTRCGTGRVTVTVTGHGHGLGHRHGHGHGILLGQNLSHRPTDGSFTASGSLRPASRSSLFHCQTGIAARSLSDF